MRKREILIDGFNGLGTVVLSIISVNPRSGYMLGTGNQGGGTLTRPLVAQGHGQRGSRGTNFDWNGEGGSRGARLLPCVTPRLATLTLAR